MFYKYDKRMKILSGISNIADNNLKKEELNKFIADEKIILNQQFPPAKRSHALSLAELKLSNLEPREIAPNIRKKLF